MKKAYFSTSSLILLALFSALIVVAKIALRLPIQLSGHSESSGWQSSLWQPGWFPSGAQPGSASLLD